MAGDSPRPARRLVTPIAVAVMLAAALQAADAAAFARLTPEIRDAFGESVQGVRSAAGLSLAVTAALVLPIGFLADRLRRPRLVALGAAILGVAAIGVAIAPSLATIGSIRFLLIGVVGAFVPVHLAVLADVAPKRASLAFAAVYLAAAPVVGRGGFGLVLFAGVGSPRFWPLAFAVIGVVALAVAAVAYTASEHVASTDAEDAGPGGDEDSWESPSWAECWRTSKAVPTLRATWIAFALFGSGAASNDALSDLLETDLGASPDGARAVGIAATTLGVIGLGVGAVILHRVLRRRGRGFLILTSRIAALAGVATVLAGVAPFMVVSVTAHLVAAALAGVIPAVLFATAMISAPPRVRGYAMAATVLAASAGAVVPSALGGVAEGIAGVRGHIVAVGLLAILAAIWIVNGARTIEAALAPRRGPVARRLREVFAGLLSDTDQEHLLQVRSVDVDIDAVQILWGVDLSVDPGEIVALLGTNGAGKSTVLRTIAGILEPTRGSVNLAGRDITNLPAEQRVAMGVAMVPGGRAVFPELTITENLILAADAVGVSKEQAIASLLDLFPELENMLGTRAGDISAGQAQMVAVGQALIGRPRLLLIDELSLGLAPAVVDRLLDVVRAAAESGSAVVLVEQSVNVAMTVADRAVFMDKGEVGFSGPTAELLARPDILRSVYLRQGGTSNGRPPADTAPTVLEVRGLEISFGGIRAVDGVDLDLRDGHILGLIGPNGSGKTTILDAITGVVRPAAGTITVDGADLVGLPIDEIARAGVQRSFSDARLFPTLTVAESIAVALEREAESRNPVTAMLSLPAARRSERRIERRVDEVLDLLGLGDRRSQLVGRLSTGQRRLVDLAAMVAARPRVLLLDEPAAGLAQRETEGLLPLLRRVQSETGCSMVVIEHDMSLLSSLADELVALHLGAVIATGHPQAVLADPSVVESYLGTNAETIERSGQRTLSPN